MESRDSSKLQITLLRYDIHIVAGLFVLQYLPDYLALTKYPDDICLIIHQCLQQKR
jgi:hypothetical protein